MGIPTGAILALWPFVWENTGFLDTGQNGSTRFTHNYFIKFLYVF